MTRGREVAVVRYPGQTATGMTAWWKVVAVVALAWAAGASDASAQSVLVRNLAPGTTVEFVLNSTVVGSAKTDAEGYASLPLAPAGTGKAEMDSYIFTETCGETRRVLVVERVVEPPAPDAACARVEIPGLFVVRPISTIVVDMTGSTPTLLLIQGAYDPKAPPRTWTAAPMGLILSGGAGLTSYNNQGLLACGSVTDCSSNNWTLGYTGAVQFWLAPFLGAEVGYIKPGGTTAEGSGTSSISTYEFNSELDGDVLTIAGLVGGPVGPLRLYGKAGANHQWSIQTETVTIADATATIDGVEQTVPGGTHSTTLRTSGWGWLFGGGMEAWVSPRFAIYGEAMWAAMKGGDADRGEGSLDQRQTMFFIGGKFHVAFGR